MTVVILASGPSLSAADLEHVKKRQAAKPDRIATIAINNTHQRAPWSSDLYACDGPWWRHYKPTFAGRKWSQHRVNHNRDLSEREALDMGVTLVPSKPGEVLDLDDTDTIRTGGNSAFQAVNLAINEGASRVVLLGVDLQPTGGLSHWHGDHPTGTGLTNPQAEAFAIFKRSFDNAARDLKMTDVEFIQASRETALTTWPRMDIETALKEPFNDWRSPTSTRRRHV